MSTLKKLTLSPQYATIDDLFLTDSKKKEDFRMIISFLLLAIIDKHYKSHSHIYPSPLALYEMYTILTHFFIVFYHPRNVSRRRCCRWTARATLRPTALYKDGNSWLWPSVSLCHGITGYCGIWSYIWVGMRILSKWLFYLFLSLPYMFSKSLYFSWSCRFGVKVTILMLLMKLLTSFNYIYWLSFVFVCYTKIQIEINKIKY